MKKIVMMFAVLTISTFLMQPVGAEEWNFYGSARVSTYFTNVDNPTSEDTNNYSQELNPDSRIGANIKVNDELSGRFEYGAGVNVRLLYGAWDFGSGEFLVGQAYSPLNWFYSNQIYTDDNNMLNYGGVYSGRNPMLQIKYGNFKIAALSPGKQEVLVDGIAVSETETSFPKIEASYQLNYNNISFDIAGGYNTYKIINGNNTHEIDSYIFAVGGTIKFDRGYYIASNLWVGQNTGSYGLFNAPVDDPTITGTTVNDNDAFGVLLVVGMVFNDMFSFEGGYGYTQAELDVAGATKDDLEAYYLQSTVTLATNVFFVPEIGIIDNKQDGFGNRESETFYTGVKWQINF